VTSCNNEVFKLKELIADCKLQINFHGPTFINAKGVEVSEIDYHLYKKTAQLLTEKNKVELNQQTRTRWDKMDTPKYESKVNTKISKLKNDSINENYSLTRCSNQRKYGKNKLKLNIWNIQLFPYSSLSHFCLPCSYKLETKVQL
jgi:hypothetical protein